VFFHLHHFILHATNVDKLLDAKAGSTRQRLLADLWPTSSRMALGAAPRHGWAHRCGITPAQRAYASLRRLPLGARD
jgi:hypothetical protein